MEQDLINIINELTSHESHLKAELAQLTSKAKEIADRLSQIQTAKAALGGTGRTGLGKHAKANSKKDHRVPTQSEIEEIISTILREKKSVPVADLLHQVKSQLLANGQSRVGLKSLFAKAVTKFESSAQNRLAH
jgi:predicted nuclease with TOPRIM domain